MTVEEALRTNEKSGLSNLRCEVAEVGENSTAGENDDPGRCPDEHRQRQLL